MTELLLGRYRRVKSLGAGAMGEVWLAEDVLLGRTVAVKQLRVAHPDSTFHDRIVREARLAAQLNHRNAVAVHDLVFEEGQPFVVMEYVPGMSLAQRIRDRGPLSPAEAGLIIGQIAGALEAAHSRGILHRDVKPANILIHADSTAKLADFGIARSTVDPHATATGFMIGTPAFIPPEIARGEEPSPAGDIWSLGATLYDAVEGHPPFGSGGENTIALLTKLITDPVPPATHAGQLAPLLAEMLDKRPDRRPTASDVSLWLARGTGGPVGAAPAAGGFEEETRAPMHLDEMTRAPSSFQPPPAAPAAAAAAAASGADDFMPPTMYSQSPVVPQAPEQPATVYTPPPPPAATQTDSFRGVLPPPRRDETAAFVLPPSVNPHGMGRPAQPTWQQPPPSQASPPPPVQVTAPASRAAAPPPMAEVVAPLPQYVPPQAGYQPPLPPPPPHQPSKKGWWIATASLIVIGLAVAAFVVLTGGKKPVAGPSGTVGTTKANPPPVQPPGPPPPNKPPLDIPTLPKTSDKVPTNVKPPGAPTVAGVQPYTDPDPIHQAKQMVEYQPALSGDPAAAVKSVVDFLTFVNRQNFQAAWDKTTHRGKGAPDGEFRKGYATSAHYQVVIGQPRKIDNDLVAIPVRFISRQDPAAQGNPEDVTDCTIWPQFVFLVGNVGGQWLLDQTGEFIGRNSVRQFERVDPNKGGNPTLNPTSQRTPC